MSRAWPSILLLLVSACGSGPTPTACLTSADCVSGQSCVAGGCVAVRDAQAPDAATEDAGLDSGLDAGIDSGIDAAFDDAWTAPDAYAPDAFECSTAYDCPLDVCPSFACVDGGCVATSMDADGDAHLAVACGGDDCDDANPNVHPGVTAFQTVPTGAPGGGFDYDCSGIEEKDSRAAGCTGGGTLSCGRDGYSVGEPIVCGVATPYTRCGTTPPLCSLAETLRVVGCR